MTAQVAIRCDTEQADGSFCIGTTSTNAAGIGSISLPRWERGALERGWSKVGDRHYCPTCTRQKQRPRKVIVLHMVYPDGTHTGDCEGCLWAQSETVR